VLLESLYNSCDKRWLSATGSCNNFTSLVEDDETSDCGGHGAMTPLKLSEETAAVSGSKVELSPWFIKCRSPTPNTTIPQSASVADVSRLSRQSVTSSGSEKYPLLLRFKTVNRPSHDSKSSLARGGVIQHESMFGAASDAGTSSDGRSSSTSKDPLLSALQFEYGLMDDDAGLIKVSDDGSSSNSVVVDTFPSVASPGTCSPSVIGAMWSQNCRVDGRIGTNRSIAVSMRHSCFLNTNNSVIVMLTFLNKHC